jgi:hypothetical protein
MHREVLPRTANDLPVTPNQEHLLLSREYFQLRQAQLGSSWVASVLLLEGYLNLAYLEAALTGLLSCHPALRATFEKVGPLSEEERAAELRSFAQSGVFRPGLYRQAIADRISPDIAHFDVSSLEPEEKSREAATIIRAETLAAGEGASDSKASIRILMIHLGSAEHLLALVVDHLVMDAWSMQTLRQDFIDFYRQSAEGSTLQSRGGGLSYGDYVASLAQAIQDGGFAADVDYWCAQWVAFAGARLGFEHLDCAMPQPPKASYAFGIERSEFDEETTQAIHTVARALRVTPYIFFLAAYGCTLREYTGRDRLALWGHFANRRQPETRQTVGWLANTHLLGLDLTGGTSLSDCFRQTRATVNAAAEHEALPVSLVWRSLGRYPRDPDAKLLLGFIPQNDPPSVAGGLRIRSAPEYAPLVGRFSNLGLYIKDTKTRFEVSAQYLQDRFHADGVRNLLTGFERVVRKLLTNPAKIRDLC